MISAQHAEKFAYQFLDARANSLSLQPLSTTMDLSIEDAYAIANQIDRIRISERESPVGRKLGSTNRALWDKASNKIPITSPTWSTLFSSTIRYLNEPFAVQSLEGALRPKLEPEIVFKLGKTPAKDSTPEELAECLEWMAHGLEIVVSPYPDWKCTLPDAIAAFGMHGMLIVGEPRTLSLETRIHVGEILASSSVSMTRGESLIGAGYGSNVMENPVYAIWHLHQILNSQEQAQPLHAGEIITTGTWMNACPINSNETWSTAFGGINLSGLSISFT